MIIIIFSIVSHTIYYPFSCVHHQPPPPWATLHTRSHTSSEYHNASIYVCQTLKFTYAKVNRATPPKRDDPWAMPCRHAFAQLNPSTGTYITHTHRHTSTEIWIRKRCDPRKLVAIHHARCSHAPARALSNERTWVYANFTENLFIIQAVGEATAFSLPCHRCRRLLCVFLHLWKFISFTLVEKLSSTFITPHYGLSI